MSSVQHLEQARAAFAAEAWGAALEAFTAADRQQALDVVDLDLMASSAYMLGRDDEYVSNIMAELSAPTRAAAATYAARVKLL